MSETTIDITGAELEIDGVLHYVESGEMSITTEYLKDARGEPQQAIARDITIEVELFAPE